MAGPSPSGESTVAKESKSDPYVELPKSDPDIEFFTRHQGTPQEDITSSELQILNSALRSLFAALREIRPLYQKAEATERRLAICVALAFYCRFIQLFQKPLDEGLDVPILHLTDALLGLNDNLVSPILQPIPKEGRSKSSDAHDALKGLAAPSHIFVKMVSRRRLHTRCLLNGSTNSVCAQSVVLAILQRRPCGTGVLRYQSSVKRARPRPQ
jgi:hypothetical protein